MKTRQEQIDIVEAVINLKPKVKLVGQDGNIYNLMGIAAEALEMANQKDKADEMIEKIMSSHSYYKALNIIREYCEVS